MLRSLVQIRLEAILLFFRESDFFYLNYSNLIEYPFVFEYLVSFARKSKIFKQVQSTNGEIATGFF